MSDFFVTLFLVGFFAADAWMYWIVSRKLKSLELLVSSETWRNNSSYDQLIDLRYRVSDLEKEVAKTKREVANLRRRVEAMEGKNNEG